MAASCVASGVVSFGSCITGLAMEGMEIMAQATFVVNCPGTVIWITPPHAHMHLEVLLRAGMLAIITVGDPGTQGATVFGMQGMGVSTPMAAAVADATVGLARDMHMPKGMIFTIGL